MFAFSVIKGANSTKGKALLYNPLMNSNLGIPYGVNRQTFATVYPSNQTLGHIPAEGSPVAHNLLIVTQEDLSPYMEERPDNLDLIGIHQEALNLDSTYLFPLALIGGTRKMFSLYCGLNPYLVHTASISLLSTSEDSDQLILSGLKNGNFELPNENGYKLIYRADDGLNIEPHIIFPIMHQIFLKENSLTVVNRTLTNGQLKLMAYSQSCRPHELPECIMKEESTGCAIYYQFNCKCL